MKFIKTFETYSKNKLSSYTREELIQLCEDAVVPFMKWNDRDSYSAQKQLSDIYGLLKIGCDFEIDDDTNDRMINITFKNLTNEQKNNYWNYSLPIDSKDSYLEEFGYDSEMFDSDGININSNYIGGYIPTRKRLDDSNGEDWY